MESVDVCVKSRCFIYLFWGRVTLSTLTPRHYNESVHRKKQHTRGNNTIPYKLATSVTFETLKWKYTFATTCSLLPVASRHWSIARRTLRKIDADDLYNNNNNNVFNSYRSTPRYIQCNLYEKKKNSCKNEFNMVNGTTPPLIAC